MTLLGALPPTARFGGDDIDPDFLGQWAHLYVERVAMLSGAWSTGTKILGRQGGQEAPTVNSATCSADRMFWFNPEELAIPGRTLQVRVLGGAFIGLGSRDGVTLVFELARVTDVGPVATSSSVGGGVGPGVPAAAVRGISVVTVGGAAVDAQVDLGSFEAGSVLGASPAFTMTAPFNNYVLAVRLGNLAFVDRGAVGTTYLWAALQVRWF